VSLIVTRRGLAVDVVVDGQLTVHERQELKRAVLGELDQGARQFRIDFGRTSAIDSSGLGMLVSLSKHVRQAGGDLRLANLNAELRTLFALTKLDTRFAIDDDAGSAGRPAPIKPRPPGPLEGRAEADEA